MYSTFASISYQTLFTNNEEIFSCFAGTHPAQPCVKKEKLFERKRTFALSGCRSKACFGYAERSKPLRSEC